MNTPPCVKGPATYRTTLADRAYSIAPTQRATKSSSTVRSSSAGSTRNSIRWRGGDACTCCHAARIVPGVDIGFDHPLNSRRQGGQMNGGPAPDLQESSPLPPLAATADRPKPIIEQ